MKSTFEYMLWAYVETPEGTERVEIADPERLRKSPEVVLDEVRILLSRSHISGVLIAKTECLESRTSGEISNAN